MAFVNKQGGEQQQDTAASGQPIDFDPNDESVTKVHYDLSAWSFDHRAELAEALADVDIPHYWDDEELVVPEVVEAAADGMFERLEAKFGPFPVGLGDDEESLEYGLDEWTGVDRTNTHRGARRCRDPPIAGTMLRFSSPPTPRRTLTRSSMRSKPANSVLSTTVVSMSRPEGVLSDIFLTANKLAKDPFDAKARLKLIDINMLIHPKHPPYALAPRIWKQTVSAVGAIVVRIEADAEGSSVPDEPVGRRWSAAGVVRCDRTCAGIAGHCARLRLTITQTDRGGR